MPSSHNTTNEGDKVAVAEEDDDVAETVADFLPFNPQSFACNPLFGGKDQ